MRYIFLFLSLFIFVTSCKKKMTIWNSDWSAPIVNDTISLKKYVNDSTLTVSNSGFYEIDLHRTILDINLSELISLPDTTISKSFSISFSNLNLPPGTNFVNSIEENTLNVEGIELKKIRLSNGYIDIKLENPINTKVFFTIQLPGVTKNGITFEQVYSAPAGSNSNPGVVEGSLNLSGYYMDLTGEDGNTYNILQSLFIVKTDPDGIETSTTSNDVTKITAKLRNIKIDYARGYFGNQIISDTSEIMIDLFSKITDGFIDLPTTSLNFSISNGFKFPAKATIYMINNENSNGNIVSLTVTNQNSFQFSEGFNIDPATGSWSTLHNSIKTLDFNSVNSNLEEYLENLGAKQKIGYSIQLNPWGNTSGGWNEIFPDSRLKVSIDASMPLSIGADGLTIKDTFDFNVTQNTEKTHVVSGELVLKATNAFPMSGGIVLNLLDRQGNIIHTIAGSEDLQSSLFGNSVSSNGLQTSLSEIHFVLPLEILSELESINKIVVTAEFNTPNPVSNNNEQVLIPDEAFLGIKLKGAFKIENRY